MTRSVAHHTDESLEDRRREIIKLLGGDEEDIRRRVSDYHLTLAEDALFDELRAIDFLLWRD